MSNNGFQHGQDTADDDGALRMGDDDDFLFIRPFEGGIDRRKGFGSGFFDVFPVFFPDLAKGAFGEVYQDALGGIVDDSHRTVEQFGNESGIELGDRVVGHDAVDEEPGFIREGIVVLVLVRPVEDEGGTEEEGFQEGWG